MASSEEIKKKVGARAAEFVENGMVVGLGTGTTAHYFINALIQRCEAGLKIQAVATSKASLELAKKGKIPLLDINSISCLDITIDGADEIDTEKRMIKGAGGAFLREKIIASMSREMIVIVDESKLADHLGKKPLPLEIVPFATAATEHHLAHLGYKGSWRKQPSGSFYVTDNGNYIYDIVFDKPLFHPEEDEKRLKKIPGVLETGFFFHLAGRLIVGFQDGQVIVRS